MPSPVLPDFPYHPDPVSTGSVVESETTCLVCHRCQGWIYTGPVYSARDDLNDGICPWCISNGSPAETYDALFTDDYGVPADVPQQVIDRVTRRTPGFAGWQQERWLYHCGDGAAFLGRVGRNDLQGRPDAVEELRQEHVALGWSEQQVNDYIDSLDAEGQPTAYLFRCRTCRRHLAYSDFT